VLTPSYTHRENLVRGEAKTTGGLYCVLEKVYALVINKSTQSEIYISCKSGTFRVAGPNEEGWVAIAVDPGDLLYGHVQLYEYKSDT